MCYTHTLTPSHSLTHSLSLSLTPSQSLTQSLTPTHSLIQSLTHPLTYSLTHTYVHYFRRMFCACPRRWKVFCWIDLNTALWCSRKTHEIKNCSGRARLFFIVLYYVMLCHVLCHIVLYYIILFHLLEVDAEKKKKRRSMFVSFCVNEKKFKFWTIIWQKCIWIYFRYQTTWFWLEILLLSYLVSFCFIFICLVLSCPVLSCLVLSCLVLSCLIIFTIHLASLVFSFFGLRTCKSSLLFSVSHETSSQRDSSLYLTY